MENIIGVLSIIVAALSVLVMLLIGWQLFNYLSFEKKIEKILNDKEKELEKKINQGCHIVGLDTKGICLYTMGVLMQSEQKYNKALDFHFRALACYNQLLETYRLEFDECFDRIYEILPILDRQIEQGLVIDNSDIEVYIKNISNLKDDRKIDLLRFFARFLPQS